MSGCAKCGNTNEWAGYIYGFCDACAKSILEASAKRLQRKAKSEAKTDKRLEQDIARAQSAIAALATAENRILFRSIQRACAIARSACVVPSGCRVRV